MVDTEKLGRMGRGEKKRFETVATQGKGSTGALGSLYSVIAH